MDHLLSGSVETGEPLKDIVYGVLSEKRDDIKDPEKRWYGIFNDILYSLAKTASRFFHSRIKSIELSEVQSGIRQFFRKTDSIERMKKDAGLQNVFFMGYCHAINQMVEQFEKEVAFYKNDSMKSVITSYKYVEPVLLALDKNYEMGHRELAREVKISEQSLSNFMNLVKKFQLFHVRHLGRNCYYTIAYPNGEEALKLVKDKIRPHTEGYTDFLLNILGSLLTIAQKGRGGSECIPEEYDRLLSQYTSSPFTCRQYIEDLAKILRLKSIFPSTLILFERTMAKNRVTIFTKDIKSEKLFEESAIENLNDNIKYRWFFVRSAEVDSEESARSFLYKQLFLEKVDRDVIERNVSCHIVPDEREDDLFGEIFDAIIIDEKIGYCCTNVSEISEDTSYNEMKQEQVIKLVSYAEM